MKWLLFLLALISCVHLYFAVRQCYGCSDDYSQFFNGTKCKDGTITMQCAINNQSCASVIYEDKTSRTKGCLVKQNGDPFYLPSGCFTDSLGRYIRICNEDMCNLKDKCDQAMFIRGSSLDEKNLLPGNHV